MKITLKNLSIIAVLSFTFSFVTGMSATIMYQEHLAAPEQVVLSASIDTANIDFS